MPTRIAEKRAEISRAYYARPANAPKNSARHISKHAIESGKLVRQPCEKCGSEPTEAHHDDYSKPLDVRWLCKPCHGQEHRKTHCIRGHELTLDNIYIRPSRNERHCRQCRRDEKRRYKQRKREAN